VKGVAENERRTYIHHAAMESKKGPYPTFGQVVVVSKCF
jgi:hypothetical protein